MTTPVQCREVYDRILPDDLAPTHVRCTYIEGHDARHSFETLRQSDEVLRSESLRAVRASGDTPKGVQNFLEAIEAGLLDPYIEAILAAGHDRKRARRGVLGFPRTARRVG